jgi:hypothetical protein
MKSGQRKFHINWIVVKLFAVILTPVRHAVNLIERYRTRWVLVLCRVDSDSCIQPASPFPGKSHFW